MKIAAQSNGTDLHIFIEDSTWKKTTQPLNREKVKIDLIVFIPADEHIYHCAVSRPVPDTHPTLLFCRETLTLANLKQKLKKAGYGEPPYEVLLGNKLFTLRKQFTDAFSITFNDYRNNQAFNDWLTILETLEAGFLLQRLKEGRRYFSRDCAAFREFNSIDEFIGHRFDIWHDATVKEYEQALANGTALCEGCEREKKGADI